MLRVLCRHCYRDLVWVRNVSRVESGYQCLACGYACGPEVRGCIADPSRFLVAIGQLWPRLTLSRWVVR